MAAEFETLLIGLAVFQTTVIIKLASDVSKLKTQMYFVLMDYRKLQRAKCPYKVTPNGKHSRIARTGKNSIS